MASPLALTILILALPLSSAGQTWRELYERGEHQMAAAVLHPLVLQPDVSRNGGLPDVDPTESLARLYWDGIGVQQDRIIGCSLAVLASHAAMFQHHEPHHPVVDRAEALQTLMCGSLSKEDRREAAQMIACPKFGPEPRTFLLDGDLSVEISRRGIRVATAAMQDHPLPAMCFERVALVRHTRVEPPPDADSEVSPRHLIELFSWLPALRTSQPQRVLNWKVLEIVRGKPEWREGRELGVHPGTTWFPVDVPTDDTRVGFSMARDGQIAWNLGTATTGVLPALPVVAPPDPPSVRVAPTGVARVAVTVLDRFGSPLAEASVRLTGVVDRDGNTDVMGSVSFESLPDGRYDVVVAKQGLAPSAPRVLDLTGSGPVSLTVTLKPYGPNMMVSIACGGYDSRTLKTLAAGATLVAHVKIADQATTDRPLGVDGATSGLMTSSRGNVLHFYKTSPLAPVAAAVMTMEQDGGRIDRGDQIDFQQANRFPPLNVGDEYVLFMVANQQGSWWVHGAEEGAFRIRNGRVEPLGGGGAAQTWKGRSTVTFFDALRAAIAAR